MQKVREVSRNFLGEFGSKSMLGGAGGPAPGALGLGDPKGPAPGALGLGTGGPAPGAVGKMGSKIGSIFKEIYNWRIYISRERGRALLLEP